MVITAQDTKLKLGYKQTEVGVIPEDWEAKTFGEVMTGFASGATPSRKQPNFYKGNIRWITSGELNYNVIMDTIEKISVEALSKSNLKLLPKGTFLIAITGMEAEGTRGSCGIVGAEATTNQHCMALFPTKQLSTDYLFHYYVYKGKSLALQYCQGTKQQDYTGKIVKLLPILLPPLPEQTAIAAALSDADALITSLDRLIAKKRDIKQATMQQLLTGRTRLPGFSGELKLTYKQTEAGLIPEDWEVHTLGEEVDQLEAGVSVNSVDEDFHMYAHAQAILKTSAASNGYFFPHENKKIAPRDIRRAKLNPRVNSIIISRMNTLDLVGECGYVDKDYPNLFLPDRLWMTRFKRESTINVKWLSYLLSHKEYKVKIKVAATGTSGSMKNISKDSLLSIKIPFPSPEEQTAIATVLSDMDAEIAALEQKRDKTHALKQGMMQELLTGKTRLI